MQTVIKNPNWWRRRTTLERCLTLVSIFAIIAVIGLVIGLVAVLLSNQIVTELDSSSEPAQALHGTNQRPTQNEVGHPTNKDPSKPAGKQDNVCLTPECIHTASLALKRLKPEVEPCDDFYQFACGTFLEEETIPEDKVAITTFSTIQDRLQLQLRDLVATKPAENELNHFKLPYALYKACMNQTLIEKLHTTPIKKFSDMFGGWPLLVGDSWDADNTWSWQEATKNFRKHGFSMDLIIDFSISVDYRNTTRRMIDIDQSSIGLSREYLVKGFNETLVNAYFDYMVDLSVLFGAEKQQALKELRESMEFEIALANISWPNEKRRNSSELYNKRTVKQVQAAYPYVDWLDYINALLGEGLSITEDEEINVSVPSFFEELGKLLAKTPKRTVANYMMFRLHAYSVSFLSEPFRKRQLQYSTALSGRQEQEARWKECVDIASGSLGIAVGSLYVRKHFKEDSKAIALEMVDNIRAVYNDILSEVEWMDEKTRVEAKEKLRRMTTHIGYPDEMLDNNKLADYYAKLEIDSDKYFESILRMNVFGTNKAFGKFRLPVNKTEWTRHARPAIVNAFYASIENSIQFPAGILQGYFFNAQRPKYMNYGAIGYVIGHEMTHGFDDQGRQFDVDGNLRDWWQPDTQAHYLEKAKCIIEQYGNYTDKTTGLNLNGVNTQGENIADNGGVKESYIAYRRWAEKNGPEPTLPGLDYTPEQMFWISAAQTWCSKFRKESLKMRITTGAHSPGEFRVIGPFGNMKDFSKDFQCPEGSTMNPVHKCIVW